MDNYISTLIVKFASPCNLNCTYCYEYNTGDDTWKKKPKYFSNENAKYLNERIKKYLKVVQIPKLNIIAHGGEPLLLGADKLNDIFSILKEGIEDKLNFGLQTNAVLVNQDIIEVLKIHNVKCGVSIDGDSNHNKFRVFHNGKPSFEDTIKGYHLLNENRLVAGILCVVDFETNPKDVLDSLCALNPKQLDLLQPFNNHDHILGAEKLGKLFSNWFVKAFDYYMNKPEWQNIQVRIFESALFSILSKKSNSDWFGGPHGNYLVIETDGNYDVLDHLKSIGSFGKTISNLTMNLASSSLLEANNKIQEIYTKYNIKSPPDSCLNCEFKDQCGGGYYPTRFSAINNSLNNSSVYCTGLFSFFNHLNSKFKNYGYQNL
jgi:uncharacterized protein